MSPFSPFSPAREAVLAERAEVEGRCHIRLARSAWGPKDALETRWWSLVLGPDQKVLTVRNGSCGDPLNTADVPRVMQALEDLGAPLFHVVVGADADCSDALLWSHDMFQSGDEFTRQIAVRDQYDANHSYSLLCTDSPSLPGCLGVPMRESDRAAGAAQPPCPLLGHGH